MHDVRRIQKLQCVQNYVAPVIEKIPYQAVTTPAAERERERERERDSHKSTDKREGQITKLNNYVITQKPTRIGLHKQHAYKVCTTVQIKYTIYNITTYQIIKYADYFLQTQI